MLSLYLSKDQWSLCNGNTNIYDLKAFFCFFFHSLKTHISLCILIFYQTEVHLTFLCESIHLLSCEKQPVYEAYNWKPRLNIGPSEVQLSKHRAVWKLLWIHLKMLLCGKLMKLFMISTIFCCSQASNSGKTYLMVFPFLASGSRRKCNTCESSDTKLYQNL